MQGISSQVVNDYATAANQATEIATLASIDAGVPASLGQKTMANSMPVVLPSDQVVVHRDELTQYIVNGFGFITSILTLTAGTTETNLIYITNPNGSGKTLYLAATWLISDPAKANFAQFFFYSNPTVTANGSAMTISNLLPGSANSSVVSAFSGPTTSAKGTLIDSQMYGGNNASAQSWKDSTPLSPYIILPPNNKLLLTATAKANGTNLDLILKWFEA